MTDREKAIVMAYTGVCMLTGNKFRIFHEYVEDIMGRPIQTIEMGMDSVADEIKEKARPDFLKLCEEDQEPLATPTQKEAHWEWNQYDANPKIGNFHCSLCHSIGRTYFDYCPYCGAKMSEIPTDQIVTNGELYPGEFDDPFAEEGSDKE